MFFGYKGQMAYIFCNGDGSLSRELGFEFDSWLGYARCCWISQFGKFLSVSDSN